MIEHSTNTKIKYKTFLDEWNYNDRIYNVDKY